MNRALAVLQQCRQLGIDVFVGDEGDLVLDFNDPPSEWLQKLLLQHKQVIIRILWEEHFAGRQCISIEEDRTPIQYVLEHCDIDLASIADEDR